MSKGPEAGKEARVAGGKSGWEEVESQISRTMESIEEFGCLQSILSISRATSCTKY